MTVPRGSSRSMTSTKRNHQRCRSLTSGGDIMTPREAVNASVALVKQTTEGFTHITWWDVDKVVQFWGSDALKDVAGRKVCDQAARKLNEVL
jgi:hypothetical protein